MSVIEVTRAGGGLAKLREKIAQIAVRMEDISPSLPDVHDRFIEDTGKLFDSGGATGAHGKWPANAASTIVAKGHAMVLHGKPSEGFHLLRSLVNPSHPDNVFRTTATTVVMGTKHWKASVHARALAPNLKKRRPVDPTRAQKEGYVKIIAIYVVEGVQGAE